MQRLAGFLFVLAVVGLVGCNTDTGGKKGDNTKRSETVKLSGPETSTTIKQGETQKVELTVNKGKDFKQDTKISVDDPPKGLTVKLEPESVKASDAEKTTVTATITADKDAPTGDHKLRVTASPKEGSSAHVEIKVKVEAKKD